MRLPAFLPSSLPKGALWRHRRPLTSPSPTCTLSDRARETSSSTDAKDPPPPPRKAGDVVFVVGKFDSLHIGHRALVSAAAARGAPTLLSFSGMAASLGWAPRAPVVAPVDRNRILRDWTRDAGRSVAWRALRFADVQQLAPADFVELLRAMRASAVVCGEDWRFGAKAAGDVRLAQSLCEERGMHLEVVPPVMYEGAPISSTRVRAALADGEVELANALMGRPHRLVGYVDAIEDDAVYCSEFVNMVVAAGTYRVVVRVLGISEPVRTTCTITAADADGRQTVAFYDANQVYCADCEVYIDLLARVT